MLDIIRERPEDVLQGLVGFLAIIGCTYVGWIFAAALTAAPPA